jgi:hypothetical protein
MKGSSMVVKKPSVREMLADPIIRAVMLRDGVTDREVTTAIAKLRRRTVRNHMKDSQAACRISGASTPVLVREQGQPMPVERGQSWRR